MGNGLIYKVPRFQRDYSWGQDEWEDLWIDIENLFQPGAEPGHYMGYLVLQSRDQKQFDIIDGQQRLTTLSILVLAVLKHIEILIDKSIDAQNNKTREEQLRNNFIGYLDPVTLIPQTKLTLNRNNNDFYCDRLVPLDNLPQRGLKSSERLLKNAFEWFVDRLKHSWAREQDGRELARFLTELSDRLFFTVITVTDELNAFKVFETLNARGVRLSPTDLLKNYLFSIVYRDGCIEREIDALERRWHKMVDILGSESFPAFLRAHWNSRRGFVREAELFKTIRRETADKKAVFELRRQMEEDIDVYAALSNPEDELWDRDERKFVRELKMFSVRQPWPLLMASFRVFHRSYMQKILRAVSIISFRYNVICGLATNIQERTYNRVAQQISSMAHSDITSVIKALSEIYVQDSRFELAFSEKVLKTTSARNRRVVMYILFSIEQRITGKEYDMDSRNFSLEHILPENPEDGWEQFSDALLVEAVYRLGNMTILEKNLNRDAGNKKFQEKCEIYRRSTFELTRRIAEENDRWDMDRLAVRQRWMAKQAKTIWRLDQLHTGI